jgi:hypothetical protein
MGVIWRDEVCEWSIVNSEGDDNMGAGFHSSLTFTTHKSIKAVILEVL